MNLSEKAQKSLDKVIAKFESGDLSPITDLALLQLQEADDMPSHKWSLANQVMAYIQSNGQFDCRGFKQWKQVGRKVQKGAQAVYILGPCTVKREDETTGEDKLVVVGFRSIPVFPLDQTEGEPLPAVDYTPGQLPPLMDVAERLNIKVEYGPTAQRGAAGWYSPSNKFIRLGTHREATFFHELAHAAHDQIDGLDGDAAHLETVADLAAAVLSQMYGQDHSGNAWDYISHFADDPLTAIYKAISTVEKVLAVILEPVSEKPLGPVAA